MKKARRNAKIAPIRGKPTQLNEDMGEAREAREKALDETLAETFPASDPLSSNPDPGPADEQTKIAS
jgi:hypothetical protein